MQIYAQEYSLDILRKAIGLWDNGLSGVYELSPPLPHGRGKAARDDWKGSMTLTREDVVAHLAPTLKAAGMRKRRYWWYWTGEEVTWAFRILKSPYGGSRLSFDLMCAPLAPGFETPATLKSDDYPLAPFLANWEIGPDVDVGMPQ